MPARTVHRVLFHVASIICRVRSIENASDPIVNSCCEGRATNDRVTSKASFCNTILTFSEDNAL